MKTIVKKQWTRMAVLTLSIGLATVTVNAQRTTTATTDFAKSANAAPGTLNGSVRVVDNKGTIKYLQTANGLTTITNTTANVTTTTWQLGGTLTDDTYIDATGKVFALDGIGTAAAGGAATNATIAAIHGGAGTGWTLLVHDESTGAVKKLIMSNLINGGHTFATIDGTTNLTSADYTYTDATFPVNVNKVSVYRNGIKLFAGTDYTVAGLAGVATVTVKHASGTDPDDYAFITGDKIEIQWIQ